MSKEIEQHVLRLYQTKKLIGSGAYGFVWRAIDRRTRRPVALKKIFDAFQNSTDAQRTYRQLVILSQLDHQNIVKFHKGIRSKNNKDLYLVFELVEADLYSLVGEQVLQQGHVRFICNQLLRALAYLHSAQLIHRDLKPSNVLINSQCRIKVCDFGLARSLTCEEQRQVVLSEDVATRWYRSPQMLLGSRSYGKSTDVWSIGCILAEVMIGRPLFPGQSNLNQIEKIIEFTGVPSKQNVDSLGSDCAQSLLNQLSVRKRSLKEYFHQCDPQLVDLVVKMLDFNPTRRITIDEALRHPSMKEFNEQLSLCYKFILPPIDDNLKLTVTQYRKLIYQDIERMYPEENGLLSNYKLTRSANSFTKYKENQPRFERRQRSLFQPNHKSANSPLKMKENNSPYKAVLEPVKQQLLEGLRRKKSQKHLIKKVRTRPNFKK